MSTGLTFGSISALFGLTNHIIDERQYTILLTAVIGSAVEPTLIAERWFQPVLKPLQRSTERCRQPRCRLKETINHVPQDLGGERRFARRVARAARGPGDGKA